MSKNSVAGARLGSWELGGQLLGGSGDLAVDRAAGQGADAGGPRGRRGKNAPPAADPRPTFICRARAPRRGQVVRLRRHFYPLRGSRRLEGTAVVTTAVRCARDATRR